MAKKATTHTSRQGEVASLDRKTLVRCSTAKPTPAIHQKTASKLKRMPSIPPVGTKNYRTISRVKATDPSRQYPTSTLSNLAGNL